MNDGNQETSAFDNIRFITKYIFFFKLNFTFGFNEYNPDQLLQHKPKLILIDTKYAHYTFFELLSS